MAKKEKCPFCEPGYNSSSLRPGSAITVGRSLVYHGEHADFKPFLDVPVKELEQRLKASQDEETKIYEELKKAAEKWDAHGAQTLLLQKTVEYRKAPEVKHTSNEWKNREDGSWEISNLVYKMTFSIDSFGDQWKLAWALSYTAPGLAVGYHEYSRTPRERIEHENSKVYKTLAGAQKYIQTKFDEHASCFSSLCPPVPKDAKALFSVNGQLLPAYTLERTAQVEPIDKAVSKLLDCLADGDIAPDKEPAPQAAPVSSAPPQDQPLSKHQKHMKKPAAHQKKRSALAR